MELVSPPASPPADLSASGNLLQQPVSPLPSTSSDISVVV
jgi:hypothetical protein